MDELEEDDFLGLDRELNDEDFAPDEPGTGWDTVENVLNVVFPYYNATLDFFDGTPAPTPASETPAATEEKSSYTGLIVIGAILLITVIGLAIYNRKKKK